MKLEKLEAISNRQIVLYPDKNAYNEWDKIAKEAKKKYFKIQTSDLLERANIDDGADIADLYLTKYMKQQKAPKPKESNNKIKNNNHAEQNRINRTRLADIKNRIARTRAEVKQTKSGIKKYRGLISWEENRSRQARTICERGF